MRQIMTQREFARAAGEAASGVAGAAHVLQSILDGTEAVESGALRFRGVETELERAIRSVSERLGTAALSMVDRHAAQRLATSLRKLMRCLSRAAALAANPKTQRQLQVIHDLGQTLASSVDRLAYAVAHLDERGVVAVVSREVRELVEQGDAACSAAVEALLADGMAAVDLVREKAVIDRLLSSFDACRRTTIALERVAIAYA